MKTLTVLDLFSGLGGWSKAFKERGHHVTTVDFNPLFKPDIVADIRDITVASVGYHNVVLMSPPCETFSVQSLYHHWRTVNGVPEPTSLRAIEGLEIVEAAIAFVRSMDPAFWIMENPRAMLRKQAIVRDIPRKTITYCQYGETRMKPTDLWSEKWDQIPLVLRAPCKNGDPCHISAPRGSSTGTQGMGTAAQKAVVAYALSEQVCLACEEGIK